MTTRRSFLGRVALAAGAALLPVAWVPQKRVVVVNERWPRWVSGWGVMKKPSEERVIASCESHYRPALDENGNPLTFEGVIWYKDVQ